MTERKDDRLWGGRFEREPDADSSTRSSVRFRSIAACCPTNSPSIARGRKALQKIGILTEVEVRDTINALDRIADGIAGRSVVPRRFHRGRRPPFRRKRTGPRTRRARLETAHRPQPQRTGRHRFPPVRHRRRGRASSGSSASFAERDLLEQAKANLGVPMAGMTHMQHAQPILLSHFLLAHAEAFLARRHAPAARRRKRRRLPHGLRRARRQQLRHRPRSHRARSRLLAHHRQQPRRRQRPRFRARLSLRAQPASPRIFRGSPKIS